MATRGLSEEDLKLIRRLNEQLGYQGNDRVLLDEVDRLRARNRKLVEAFKLGFELSFSSITARSAAAPSSSRPFMILGSEQEPEWLARIERHATPIQSTEDAEKFAQTCMFMVGQYRELRAENARLREALTSVAAGLKANVISHDIAVQQLRDALKGNGT